MSNHELARRVNDLDQRLRRLEGDRPAEKKVKAKKEEDKPATVVTAPPVANPLSSFGRPG